MPAHQVRHDGVVLRYPVGQAVPVRRRPFVDDRERVALITAESELQALSVIFNFMEASDLARTRVARALETIRRALNKQRLEYGMAVPEEEAF